ncbi:unnamed protein product [Porites lobata]|uniref:Uncharacterized protein n=1 Tax=Porites lobata TaxID=104759 RepID=A0ABN8P0H4_9CNID|nr:unnamed protein product [Porites lobata]
MKGLVSLIDDSFERLMQKFIEGVVNTVDPTQLGVGSYLSVKWLAADHSNKYFRAVILTLEVILSAFGVETGNQNDK